MTRFYIRDGKCLLRNKTWIFKRNRLLSLLKGYVYPTLNQMLLKIYHTKYVIVYIRLIWLRIGFSFGTLSARQYTFELYERRRLSSKTECLSISQERLYFKKLVFSGPKCQETVAVYVLKILHEIHDQNEWTTYFCRICKKNNNIN
jgi:hypothetical protein